MDSTPMPINELPAREPGYRMALPRVDEDAEKLADLLNHSCMARSIAAGTNEDPHWRCATCNTRIEICFPFHMGQWQFEIGCPLK